MSKVLYKRLKDVFKINENILEKILKKILIITDLKLDDNLAIIEVVNKIRKLNIQDFEIDIIITNIYNFNKMLNNLLIHSTIIKEYVKDNKITFYEGIKSKKEKRHENVVNDIPIENNIKQLNYLYYKTYTICFVYASIYPFCSTKYINNNINLFFKCRCMIIVLGHGYNTICEDNYGKPDYIETMNYLNEISKNDNTKLILYMNNYASFDDSAGKIVKENKLFIKDQIFKIIIGSKNIKEIEDAIFRYYKHIDLNNIHLIKKIISDDLNNCDKIIIFLKKIKEILDNNKNIKEKVEFNYFYLQKTLDNIKNKNEVEITDWSQMLLFLNIFDNRINYNVKGLKFNINNKGIMFGENEKEHKMFYICDVKWNELFK